MQPILQIVHISDLHISESSNDKAVLARKKRLFRLKFRKVLERGAEWHEGTLSHDETAERSFGRFIAALATAEPGWFGNDDSGTPPQTWLVDTGDLSTFGDHSSIQSGIAKLDFWRTQLRDCNMRALFGNHDAWPGTFPLLVGREDYREQWQRVRDWPEWCNEQWIDPLTLDVPGTDLRIELYALSTVRFTRIANTRAVGAIGDDDLERLAAEIRKRKRDEDGRRVYRILATHHPIAFPFEPEDRLAAGIVPVMRLGDSKKIIEFLKNELDADADFVPYIHLLLSGHTHLSFPADPLPLTVKELTQGTLGEKQAQLVAGALMLVRVPQQVSTGLGPQQIPKHRDDFIPATVYNANQQFQILRFYHAPELTPGLILRRYIVARIPPDEYGVIEDFGDPRDDKYGMSVLPSPSASDF